MSTVSFLVQLGSEFFLPMMSVALSLELKNTFHL